MLHILNSSRIFNVICTVFRFSLLRFPPPQGAALSLMMGWMTYGKKKFDTLDSTMRRLIPPIYQVMIDLIPLVDADTDAFNTYMVR